MSKQKMAHYEQNENTLMKQFIDSFKEITEHSFTTGRVAYDGWYKTSINDIPTVFEIKVRNTKIDQYPDYILQADKANSLAKFVNKGYNVKYINFFTNDTGTYDCIVFDINYRTELWRKQGMENVIEQKYMNAATYISNQKIAKNVIMLKYDDKIDSKITNTKWQL